MAYTPIFDSLFEVDKINLTDVAVFGAVWRYSQGKLKRCVASPKTIGEGLGLSPNTVRASLKKLCSEKYQLLKDLTPEANSKAHEYIPTEKALAIIAREVKKEEPVPDPKPIPDEEKQGGVPEFGTQELVPADDRVPEFGRGGYQNLVGGVPEFGNEERINKESIREREDAPAHVHEDYLDSVINGQGKTSEKTDSNPEDQYFEYRDNFLATYLEMVGRYPDTTAKDEISKLITKGITARIWAESWRQCKLNYPGPNGPTLARVIEVCDFGGDYDKWRRARFPDDNLNGRDSPPGPPRPTLRTVPVESD